MAPSLPPRLGFLKWSAALLLIGCAGAVPVQADEVQDLADALAENQQSAEAKQQEIAELEAEIERLRSQRDQTATEANLINAQLKRLTSQLEKTRLDLKQTQLTIDKVRREQQSTEQTIEQTKESVEEKREQLRHLFRLLYQQERASLVEMFLSADTISDFLTQRATYRRLQEDTFTLVQELRAQEEEMKQRQTELDEQAAELGRLHTQLASQQGDLAHQRTQQSSFLAAKQEEQVEYENLIAEAKQARDEIKRNVFTLKSANVELSLTEATDIAKLAGKLTGIRPALLLGVLKIETNLGTNIGSGVFPDDMQPQSHEAFLRVTKKLGLDPNTAPISARPKNYSGWGGAMGPGQFMPATWETIEERVAKMLGKDLANPYELVDAFVATAIFLADRGAATPAQEYEAVNRYLAGPNWQRFTWYGDKVLAVAKEYESQGF